MSRDIDAVGQRIEEILAELTANPAAKQLGEELVHTLLAFYGTGLGRMVEVAQEADGRVLDAFAADPVVAGLLVLHDLHPRSTVERVSAALEQIRPYLGSHAGDVELLGVDEDGVVRLRLTGTCDGCPSSTVTAKHAIERAIREAAPEVGEVDVLGVVPEPVAPNGRPLLPLEPCPVPEVSR